MGKRLFQALTTTMSVAVMLLCMNILAYAAGTITVSTDKESVQSSDRFTLTVQTSEPEDTTNAPQISIRYDSSALKFESCDVEYNDNGDGEITIDGKSAQLQFTALKDGEAKIDAQAVIDGDTDTPATGSVTVNVGDAATEVPAGNGGSNDAALRALVVDQGTLVPAFSPEITEYTIYVAQDVTDIKVSGGVRDEAATITSASGFKNLQSDTSEATITVVAADGSTTQTYRFTIERGKEAPEQVDTPTPEEADAGSDADAGADSADSATEEKGKGKADKSSKNLAKAGSMEIDTGSEIFRIHEKIETLVLPPGCEKSTLDYFGTNIETAVFTAGNLKLVYAVSDVDSRGEFFIYDEESQSFMLFAILKGASNKYIIPIPTKEKVPAGFQEDSVEFNGTPLLSYRVTKKNVPNAEDYYLFYAVNQDGNEGYYLYDKKEATYQRFLNYSAKGGSSSASASSTSAKSKVAIILLIILLVCMVLWAVSLLLKNQELTSDLEILANARERRRSAEGAKPAGSAQAKQSKKVVVPASEDGEPIAQEKPKKTEPKKKLIPKRVLNPGEDDELGMAEKANVRTDLPVEKEEKKEPVKKAAVKKEQPKKEGEFKKTIVGATDDLSDVADLLDNEENEQFMKTLESFSTGQIDAALLKSQTASSKEEEKTAKKKPAAEPAKEEEPEDDLEEIKIETEEETEAAAEGAIEETEEAEEAATETEEAEGTAAKEAEEAEEAAEEAAEETIEEAVVKAAEMKKAKPAIKKQKTEGAVEAAKEETAKAEEAAADAQKKAPAKAPQVKKAPVKKSPAPKADADSEKKKVKRPVKKTKPDSDLVEISRKPVPLTRESGPDEPDEDFEFEFISVDDDES